MTVRYLCGAVMAGLLTYGVPTVASAQILPPEEEGMVTVAGCLQIRDADHKDQYILANPVPGPVDSVPDGRCSATIDGRRCEAAAHSAAASVEVLPASSVPTARGRQPGNPSRTAS